VWFESFPTPMDAILCEKRIKGWLREKKVALFTEQSPEWRDLSDDWQQPWRKKVRAPAKPRAGGR
jgi:putative endonuclease